MAITKVMCMNLKRRPERLFMWLGALQVSDVPMDIVEVFYAHDGLEYKDGYEVAAAAKQDFSFWPDDYCADHKTAELCTIWSYLSVLKKVAEGDTDEAVLLMLDDMLFAGNYSQLQVIVNKLGDLGDFKLLQITNSNAKPHDRSGYQALIPGIPGVSPGLVLDDTVLVISPAGAQMLLSWYAEQFFPFFLELFQDCIASKSFPDGVYFTTEVFNVAWGIAPRLSSLFDKGLIYYPDSDIDTKAPYLA